MLAIGRLQALSEGNHADTPAQFTVDVTGRIRFTHRFPSINRLLALGRFSDRADGKGSELRFKPDSLRRGSRAGIDIEMIVVHLWQGGHDGLPEEVSALVRPWARDRGAGALAEATLLQIESAEILQDLLADPELSDDLKPVPGAATLAILRPGSAAKIRK